MHKIFPNIKKKLGQAISTLSKMESMPFEKIATQLETGNYLIVHFGQGTEIDFIALSDILGTIGFKQSEYSLDLFPGYPHAYLKLQKPNQAELIKNYLSEKFGQLKKTLKIEDQKPDESLMNKSIQWSIEGKDRCIFFFNTNLSQEKLKCCSGNANLISSATTDFQKLEKLGLFVIPDCLSEDSEKEIADCIYLNKWENLSHRRVQHYGYKFIYGLNSVNSNEQIKEIPQIFQNIFRNQMFNKFADFCNKKSDSGEFPSDYFDQVTVNEYKPGSGIPPHIDSHAPFEEMLVSVSLLSDIVMNLQNSQTLEEINFLLPAKSALVMTGQARYLWKHSIADRKIDKLPTGLFFRKTRLSLTFRKLKATPFCECIFREVCDFQKLKSLKVEEKMDKNSPDFESIYVKDVYNSIAEHFSHTRYKPWPKVEEFLKSLSMGSIVGDFGCGNGKYIFCVSHLNFVGLDISQSFADICVNKNSATQVMVADSSSVPIRSGSLDHAISIAVIHHFSSCERRKSAINELVRIVRPEGRVLIYVWAFEQQDGRFESQDVFVPWNNQKKFEKTENEGLGGKEVNLEKNTVIYKRYYHVFVKGEIEELLEEVRNEGKWDFEIVRSYYDHENWCVEILKH